MADKDKKDIIDEPVADITDDTAQPAEDVAEVEDKNYLDDLLRLQAEFDNYRKRTLKSIDSARQDGFITAITIILPSLDSLRKAGEMIKDEDTLKGIKLIESSLMNALASLGVEKIDCSGEFDIHLHEAVGLEEHADIPSGHIVREFNTGYTYQGRVVRFAQVIVNK